MLYGKADMTYRFILTRRAGTLQAGPKRLPGFLPRDQPYPAGLDVPQPSLDLVSPCGLDVRIIWFVEAVEQGSRDVGPCLGGKAECFAKDLLSFGRHETSIADVAIDAPPRHNLAQLVPGVDGGPVPGDPKA